MDLFDIEAFNTMFDKNVKLEKASKTSETTMYTLPDNTILSIHANLIDPSLVNGKNYINPLRDDFIDPNQDSADRIVLMILVNKFNKQMLVMPHNNNRSFRIPGGPPKIVESYEHAVCRKFAEIMGIELDQKQITKILCSKGNDGKEICTYMAHTFKEYEDNRKLNGSWIHIKNLLFANNQYCRAAYDTIIHSLY